MIKIILLFIISLPCLSMMSDEEGKEDAGNPSQYGALKVMPEKEEDPCSSSHAQRGELPINALQHSLFNKLPVELLELIFSYLTNPEDIKNARLVCRNFKETAKRQYDLVYYYTNFMLPKHLNFKVKGLFHMETILRLWCFRLLLHTA